MKKITKYKCNGHVKFLNENKKLHNINDDPAIIWKDGSNIWYKNGLCHRTKGPAAIYPDGYEYWFYEGNDITDKVNQLMEEGLISSDWRNWSEEDEFLFVLLVS